MRENVGFPGVLNTQESLGTAHPDNLWKYVPLYTGVVTDMDS